MCDCWFINSEEHNLWHCDRCNNVAKPKEASDRNARKYNMNLSEKTHHQLIDIDKLRSVKLQIEEVLESIDGL